MDNTVEIKNNAVNKSSMKILVFLIIIGAVMTAYFYSQAKTLEQDPNKVAEAKVSAVVAKVDLLIDLPKGENPVVATVSDLAPLAGNPFFAKASVGDEVLLYPVAQKAYLYNPTKNIIIQIASFNIGK